MLETLNSRKLQKIVSLRRQRRIGNAFVLSVFILGPLLAICTFLILGPFESSNTSTYLRSILLLDIIYVFILAGLIALRVVKTIAARRAKSAGSQLHLRLSTAFIFLSIIPTIIVAVFAVVTINFGLEGWFSQRVKNVVNNSQAAAAAYQQEHNDGLEEDTLALASYITSVRRRSLNLTDASLREVLHQAQSNVLGQREIKESYIISRDGSIITRGDRSYLFDFEPPSEQDFSNAESGQLIFIEDWDNNESRALIRLQAFADHYLYVSRLVEGEILALLSDTQQTISAYNRLEKERGRLILEFALIYIGFALLLILSASWIGLVFAERLSRPIGQLAIAAQRVGEGDFSIRVSEEETNDEISLLRRSFNTMTGEIKAQRDALLERNEQIDRRRRLFDNILTSVTSGVIALDNLGHITLCNRSALILLNIEHEDQVLNQKIETIAPEFQSCFDELRANQLVNTQSEITLIRLRMQEKLLLKIATRYDEDNNIEGYVLAFDDVTDLVSAQRSAAWGDVARRIAHEIKNPLTPIQLSAERILRKFGKNMSQDEKDSLEQYTSVIVRQTGDLGRIVDEFSQFARMPAPVQKETNLIKVLDDVILLQENARDDIIYDKNFEKNVIELNIDSTMIGQALTNLLKNAAEAIDQKIEQGDTAGYIPKIIISVLQDTDNICIKITDNGIGLPSDRSRLFEPYVTTRKKGTGLGLAIVKKILEEHNATLDLSDGEMIEGSNWIGACATVRLQLSK